MRESASKRVEKANPGSEQVFGRCRTKFSPEGEQACGGIRTTVRANTAIATAAKRRWPRNTAAELALRTGHSHRAAEYWLALQREMGLEAFAELLRSDDGFAFLDAVMATVPPAARPAWWRKLVASQRRAEIRRKQKELADAIDDLTREEEQLGLELRLGGPGEGARGAERGTRDREGRDR